MSKHLYLEKNNNDKSFIGKVIGKYNNKRICINNIILFLFTEFVAKK